MNNNTYLLVLVVLMQILTIAIIHDECVIDDESDAVNYQMQLRTRSSAG